MLKAIEKAGLEIQLTSLTEVLILIVFVLLLASSRDGATINIHELRIEELTQKLAELQDDLIKIRQENRELRAELKGAQTTIALLKEYMDPLRDRADISDEELIATFKDLIDVNRGLGGSPTQVIAGKNKKIMELKAELKASEVEIDRVTKALGGGINKPNCFIKGMLNQYSEIATVELLPNGYAVSGEWEPITEDNIIDTVPGLMAFASGFLTPQEFSKAGNQVFRWGDKQKRKCRFRVNVRKNADSFPSASEYEKSLSRVERYFYKRELKD